MTRQRHVNLGDRPPIKVVFGDHPQLPSAIRTHLNPALFEASFQELALGPPVGADIVVPLGVGDYPALKGWPGEGRELALYPRAEAADLCGDKLALSRFLIARGFGAAVPALRQPGAPWPYVWKRRRGAWGQQVVVVRCAADETGLDLTDLDWFAQDLEPGEAEFAGHVLRDRGRIWYAATTGYRLDRPDGVRGVVDAPVHVTFQRGCAHLPLFAEILRALDYEGTACFNYKLAGDTPRIFEINGRFGSSLVHDINGYLHNYRLALQARRGEARP